MTPSTVCAVPMASIVGFETQLDPRAMLTGRSFNGMARPWTLTTRERLKWHYATANRSSRNSSTWSQATFGA